jgi:hypothetical protein
MSHRNLDYEIGHGEISVDHDGLRGHHLADSDTGQPSSEAGLLFLGGCGSRLAGEAMNLRRGTPT